MKKSILFTVIIALLLSVIFFSSCKQIVNRLPSEISKLSSGLSINDNYFTRGVENNDKLTKLFSLLEQNTESEKKRFIIIKQISGIYLNAGETDKMNAFLTSYVEKHPNDAYNAYYLYLVGQNYKKTSAYSFAIYYFDRILKNHPNLVVNGKSLHRETLEELLDLVEDPEYRIKYYKELISRFSKEINMGVTYYFLAKAYEEAGEGQQAIQSYKKFLQYPDANVPGNPQAYSRVQDMIEFANSSKDWTMESLQDLINAIKYAVYNRQGQRLEYYRAKVNFFTVFWGQQSSDTNERVLFDLSKVLQNSNVRFERNLDIKSNADEAYLKTWGWAYRTGTWYLAFRKVDYPFDPEINGRWEWAGIYFGDKL